MQVDADGTEGADDPKRHRRAFGRELESWRRRRGLTLRGLADLIPCSGQLVHQVCRGEDRPAPWMVVRADWCLGADGKLVDAFITCWLAEELERSARPVDTRAAAQHHLLDERLLVGPEEVALRVVEVCSRITAAVASWDAEMKRRAFVRWSIFGAAGLPAAMVAGGVGGLDHLLRAEPARSADTVALEQLRDTVVVCRRLDDQGMSTAVLDVSRRAIARADALLRECSSTAMRRSLTLVAGELCQVRGWAAAALQDEGTAARSTALALAAADEADSPELRAYTMSLNLADAPLSCAKDCDLAATAAAVSAAQTWAQRSGNPTALSYGCSVAARVHARAGDDTAALRALEESERYLERSTSEDRPTWLYWYDLAVLAGLRGRCLLDLRRARRAGVGGLDEVVGAFRAALSLSARVGGYPREQAGNHLWLADSYWEFGEREQAARHASDALVLSAGMERRSFHERLAEYRQRMEGVPLPAAREFVDRHHALSRS